MDRLEAVVLTHFMINPPLEVEYKATYNDTGFEVHKMLIGLPINGIVNC